MTSGFSSSSKCLSPVLGRGLCFFTLCLGPACGESLSPYLGSTLSGLMDAVTFQVSFDRGDMQPDLAAGSKYRPKVYGTQKKGKAGPAFEPGIQGKALVLGTGYGIYPSAGNIPLESRGAIALWVKPLEWQRPNGGNVVFVMTTNSTFYLERQGPLRDKDGRVRRQECIFLLARPSKEKGLLSITGAGRFENGKWYFIVANWSWPRFEISINGQPFRSKSLSRAPEPSIFGNLTIGAAHGEKGLLDEVLAFRRPLDPSEVRLLHEALKP